MQVFCIADIRIYRYQLGWAGSCRFDEAEYCNVGNGTKKLVTCAIFREKERETERKRKEKREEDIQINRPSHNVTSRMFSKAPILLYTANIESRISFPRVRHLRAEMESHPYTCDSPLKRRAHLHALVQVCDVLTREGRHSTMRLSIARGDDSARQPLQDRGPLYQVPFSALLKQLP